jgi:hypothetical protein
MGRPTGFASVCGWLAAPGVRSAPGKFPLIVLSHCTGGSAPMMGWLGSVLASHRYISVAVNHPGNNALEPYTVAGFPLWWERATDLSEVIDQMLGDAEFGGRIDSKRIAAGGFSLGDYTMIEIVGGITDRGPIGNSATRRPPTQSVNLRRSSRICSNNSSVWTKLAGAIRKLPSRSAAKNILIETMAVRLERGWTGVRYT